MGCTGGVGGRAAAAAGAFSLKDFPNPQRLFSFAGFVSAAFLPPPSSPRSHLGAQPISDALPLPGRRPHEAFSFQHLTGGAVGGKKEREMKPKQ